MQDIPTKYQSIGIEYYHIEFIERMLKNLSAGANLLDGDYKFTGEVMQVEINSIQGILDLYKNLAMTENEQSK